MHEQLVQFDRRRQVSWEVIDNRVIGDIWQTLMFVKIKSTSFVNAFIALNIVDHFLVKLHKAHTGKSNKN